MRKKVRTITLYTIGWTLIPLGALGLVMPLVPGILLVVFGFLILTEVSPTMRRFSLYLRRKSTYCDIALQKFDMLFLRATSRFRV